MGLINLQTLRLPIGSLIPIDPQPRQALKNHLDRLFSRACAIGILHAQHKNPAWRADITS